jgi:hypothetical protein
MAPEPYIWVVILDHMRFLIVPNFALPYDQRMVRGLALGLRSLGHEAQALSTPIEDLALASVCRTYDADVVLRVNRFRPLYDPLPAKVRHIGWFQDVFPETLAAIDARIQAKDIVYVLGDPQTLGFNVELPCFVSTLLTGVDETVCTPVSGGNPVDFSLCGYIPPPLRLRPSIKKDLVWLAMPLFTPFDRFGLLPDTLLKRLRGLVPYAMATGLIAIVETMYQPLKGNLDIHQLTAAMDEFIARQFGISLKPIRVPAERRGSTGSILPNLMAPYLPDLTEPRGRRGTVQRFISYLARDHPRMLDRVMLIDAILSVSRSLELYGSGWSEHSEFREFHKGVLDSSAELANVFSRSRLNLANNTHGLGLHSRTLECMAVGGFIFMHASPADNKPGGMHTAFEPGVHYGLFEPETIAEEARRWLRDETSRNTAAAKAAAIVKDNHTWRHRAQQILDDLAR